MIKEFTDLGAYFSFNIQLLEVRYEDRLVNFRHLPLQRLLVETDAPTKAPAPASNRFPLPPGTDGNEINHPANIVVTYAALAELRGLTLDSLAERVEQNFNELFIRE